jgi:hypothetical protein
MIPRMPVCSTRRPYSAIRGNEPAAAMRDTTLISAALFALAFALSFLLPKEARMDDPH